MVFLGLIDDRPSQIQEKERFKDAKRWRAAAFEEIPEPNTFGPQIKPRRKENSSDDSDPDVDGPRRRRNDDPDLSPPRRKKHQHDADPSPLRRRRHQSDDDPSPPRRRDTSPRRKKHNDSPPPRKRPQTADDSSPPRRKHRHNDDPKSTKTS